MYLIYSYIKHYFRSIKLHGVHSPFVYNLVTKCFYDKTSYPEYQTLGSHRKGLLKDKRTIKVSDYGKGSLIFKNNTRKISAIAKHAGIDKKRQRLLFRLAKYFDFKNSLELGTSVGLASMALALHKTNNILTLEGCPETAQAAQAHFDKYNVQNISLVQDTFENFLKKPLPVKPDFIYFDGNHDRKLTLKYFYTLLPQTHNDSVFIFDDIYWSKEMTAAWKEISTHPDVTVSIDSFYWGIVFFRKEQPKESFTIRM